MSRYPDHPLAALFPMMEGPDFEDLVGDIRENGLREPIVLFESKILDGRNRAKACAAAGINPRFEPFEGSEEEATAFVISLNLRRRHLSESQRATVAARLATLKVGRPTKAEHTTPRSLPEKPANLPVFSGPLEVRRPVQSSAPSQAAAAKMLNVSERSVRDAKAMIEKAVPGLVKAVDQGKISVASALIASKQSALEQKRFVEVPKVEQRRAVQDWKAAAKARSAPVDEDMEIETISLAFLQIHEAKITPASLMRRALAGTLQDLREHSRKVRDFLNALEGAQQHDAA